MRTYEDLKAVIEARGVHEVFGAAREGWAIEQSPHELATFLVRMQELGVNSCLEIGTGYKGGLSRFLAAEMGWQVTTVDVQDYGHAFEGVEYVVLTFETMTEQWIDNFDLIFIDGDHDYKSVKFDFSEYLPYAGKVIAFHDILGLRGCEGVSEFWYELKRGYKDTEMHTAIADATASGIGWIEL